jgi:hypothetical protein
MFILKNCVAWANIFYYHGTHPFPNLGSSKSKGVRMTNCEESME